MGVSSRPQNGGSLRRVLQAARTRRRRAPPAPFGEARLFEAFLDTAPESVYFKDGDSRFLHVSQALAESWGCSRREELVGRSDSDFLAADVAAQTAAEEQGVMRSGRPFQGDEQYVGRGGEGLWLETWKLPLRDGAGRIVGTFGLTRDVTRRKEAEEEVARQARRLARIVETQRDVAAAALTVEQAMTLVCERVQELTGAGGAAVMLRDRDVLAQRVATGFLAGSTLELADGSAGGDVPAAWRGAGIRSLIRAPLVHGGTEVGLVVVASKDLDAFRDDDLKALELLTGVVAAALSQAAELEAKRAEVQALDRFRSVFECASIGIMRFCLTGRVIEANPALEDMLGTSTSALRDRAVQEVISDRIDAALLSRLAAGADDCARFEQRIVTAHGRSVWTQVTITLEQSPEHGVAIAMIEDIDDRKAAEAALRLQLSVNEQLALHDPLTGLANRTLFHDRADAAIAEAIREQASFALVMIDLDRFKDVNDSLGHQVGDALLREIADRLQTRLRATDTVARLGGDEFGVLLPGADRVAAAGVVGALRTAIERPAVHHGVPITVDAAIGIALYPEHGADMDTLVRHADEAMYAAKHGTAAGPFYEPGRTTLPQGERRRAAG